MSVSSANFKPCKHRGWVWWAVAMYNLKSKTNLVSMATMDGIVRVFWWMPGRWLQRVRQWTVSLFPLKTGITLVPAWGRLRARVRGLEGQCWRLGDRGAGRGLVRVLTTPYPTPSNPPPTEERSPESVRKGALVLMSLADLCLCHVMPLSWCHLELMVNSMVMMDFSVHELDTIFFCFQFSSKSSGTERHVWLIAQSA